MQPIDSPKPVRALAVLLCAMVVLPAQALTLEQALSQAQQQAPLLKASAAGVQAAEQARIPAAALPDPQLRLGLQNVPIESDDRLRLNREPMTMQMVGLMQEMPSRAKRDAWQATM